MTTYQPIFHSPISNPQSLIPHPKSKIPWTAAPPIRGAGGRQNLKLSDLTGVPIVLIQGEADDLLSQHFAQIPTKPGDLVEAGDGLLARLTPTEFYLFGLSPTAKLPSATSLDDTFAQARRFVHATDYTHGKAVLRLAGPHAPEVLSTICGLDFHDTVFPTMRLAQTSAAKIKTLIARRDEDGTPTYYLHVNRPLGQYFWEIIWEAGQELFN